VLSKHCLTSAKELEGVLRTYGLDSGAAVNAPPIHEMGGRGLIEAPRRLLEKLTLLTREELLSP